jgi:hypothetical protein
METVYLVQKDLSKIVAEGIITLFNARHVGLGSLGVGATYQEMKELKESLIPIKGAGYIRNKNAEEYWVLPFYSHPEMGEYEDVEVLTSVELKNYGWDVEEVI